MHDRLWSDAVRTTEVSIRCHQPLIKFESILPHRKVNRVLTRFVNIQINLVPLTAMLFLSSLFAVPAPRLLAFAPL